MTEPSESNDEQIECPKCGTALRAAATACARCGLARDRFAGFAANVDADVPASLASRWAAVLADWDNPDKHEQFFEAGLALQAFPYMARCYRSAARDRGDDPVARERLADIARRAEAAILTAATVARYREEEQEEPFKRVALMLAVLIVVIAAGTGYAMMSGGLAGPP